MRERYRTLGAMLALGEFSVAEVAELAQVGESTVRTVLRREDDHVERVGLERTGRRGGQPVRWRLRPGARESIRALLKELEDLGAGSWLDDPSTPDSPKAAVLAAEDVLLRLAPAARDPDERAELIKLARAQAETAEGTVTPQAEAGLIANHLHVVRLLLELEEMEQSVTQPESAGVLQRVSQVFHDLLLAAGRTQDMRLGDAVRHRVPDSLYGTNFLISHRKPNYPEPARSYLTTEHDRPSGRNVLVGTRPARLFGTDGVRGIAGRDLSAPLALDLGIAAAQVLAGPDGDASRAVAVIGRDPSLSGQFLESAIIAGLTSSGVDVIRIGVAPAAAVAFLTAMHRAQLGVSLSASHSRAPYNGIKFFGPRGYKLQDSVEDEIERQLIAVRGHDFPATPPAVFGEVRDGSDEIEYYISHVLSSLPDNALQPLAGLRVVVDCANGAASKIAPRLLRLAGAEVTAEIGVSPDGQNINVGYGSTDLDALIAKVKESKADAGIAYDGDADGCIAVDHLGNPIDGDKILATLALELAEQGKLAHRTVVMTVMSNLGFRLAMQNAGIRVVETQVGDRYLADEIRNGDYSLGGTQSGRIIIADHAKGPDGLLVSLYLLAIAAKSGKPLASVTDVMTRHPQVLVNVDIPNEERALLSSSHRLINAVEEAAGELGQHGRIVLRPSGTESVVRVMVEDDDRGQAERLARQLAETVRELV